MPHGAALMVQPRASINRRVAAPLLPTGVRSHPAALAGQRVSTVATPSLSGKQPRAADALADTSSREWRADYPHSTALSLAATRELPVEARSTPSDAGPWAFRPDSILRRALAFKPNAGVRHQSANSAPHGSCRPLDRHLLTWHSPRLLSGGSDSAWTAQS